MTTTAASATVAEAPDDRLLSPRGVRGAVTLLVSRVRGGDLGSLPVIVGLVVIWTVFQALNPVFLSSTNLVNLTMQCAAIGTIALGIVLVLLRRRDRPVGRIRLRPGGGGARRRVRAAAVESGARPGGRRSARARSSACSTGSCTRDSVLPSFVITLAGLLGFLGLQLWVLGATGSISLPFDSWLV